MSDEKRLEDVAKLNDALGAFPGLRKVTATTEVLRDFLLRQGGVYRLYGTLWDIKSEHIGAGVHKAWLEIEEPIKTTHFIDIVFDGPPSHKSGRFIEVENEQGASVGVGEWIDRKDGFWALRIPRRDHAKP